MSNPRFTLLAPTGQPLAPGATGHIAVLEPARGLMWAVEVIGRRDWAAAKQACADLRLLGHADWRLPTRDELLGLTDITRWDPAIDTDAFPGTPSSWFWTSSPGASVPSDCAWFVYFYSGYAGIDSQAYTAFVRAVRSVAPPSGQ